MINLLLDRLQTRYESVGLNGRSRYKNIAVVTNIHDSVLVLWIVESKV